MADQLQESDGLRERKKTVRFKPDEKLPQRNKAMKSILLCGNLGAYIFAEYIEKDCWVPFFLQLTAWFFLQAQVIGNALAVQSQRHKNCPMYQMNRLGLNAKKLALSSDRKATIGTKVYRAWRYCKTCESDMVGYCVAVQTQRYFLTMCFYITVMGLWGSIVSFSYHWDEIVYMTPTCWDDIVYAWGVLCGVPGQLWQDPEGSITRAFWATLFYEKPLIITLLVTQVALLAVVSGITFFSEGHARPARYPTRMSFCTLFFVVLTLPVTDAADMLQFRTEVCQLGPLSLVLLSILVAHLFIGCSSRRAARMAHKPRKSAGNTPTKENPARSPATPSLCCSTAPTNWQPPTDVNPPATRAASVYLIPNAEPLTPRLPEKEADVATPVKGPAKASKKKKKTERDYFAKCRFCSQGKRETVGQLELCAICTTRTLGWYRNPNGKCVMSNCCELYSLVKGDEYLCDSPQFRPLMICLVSRCPSC
ncbi:unnamed protein product, partial [Mesorhabditis spiculigera]